MEEKEQTFCPWCQTEIVWDPEIGPEEECPHCFNELSEYRSLSIDVDGSDNEGEHDEEATTAPSNLPLSNEDLWDDAPAGDDAYRDMVNQCMDTQLEAPDCAACRELMLFAGTQNVKNKHFTPIVPQALGVPFLTGPFEYHVYVCPSCFRVEHLLSDHDRKTMIERLTAKK
ncbi:hypothetical protein NV379_19850 [Paenibacillus sp. N1-5-1-14]|uniref:hypothetical protein n=1 Tax=Paenibacillus radicibacter TaxID=2972488 RepID=UPI0021593942|nr:hypothetical protein [Paenibacillus radicibacter]MCR8644912.1 hypothetical protein [Paenibacillus radicibacter]